MIDGNTGKRLTAALAGVLVLGGCTQTLPERPYLAIAEQGSFTAGGTVRGQPGSTIACDHGYVEYQVPAVARPVPVFLWHSSSAAVWQHNWAGGEGLQAKLLRRNYATYVWDGPRVGRANWGCADYTYQAREGRDQQNFTAWRLGPTSGEFFPGVQFPVGDAVALEAANRSRYDEFDTVPNARIETAAAAAALERIGPAVLVTNSAAGFRALLTRLQTDNVAGIIAYENPGYIFPEGMQTGRSEGPFGPLYVSEEEFAKLTRIPIQLVWGDNIEQTANWSGALAMAEQFAAEVNRRGGHVEILRLTDAGLHGNTHIPFADLNNEAVAGLMFGWLDSRGF